MERFSPPDDETSTIRPLEYVADQIVKHLSEGGPEHPKFRSNLDEWHKRKNNSIDSIQHTPSRQKKMHEMNLELGRIYARAGYYVEAMNNYYEVYRTSGQTSEYLLKSQAKAELDSVMRQFSGEGLKKMQAALVEIEEEFDLYFN